MNSGLPHVRGWPWEFRPFQETGSRRHGGGRGGDLGDWERGRKGREAPRRVRGRTLVATGEALRCTGRALVRAGWAFLQSGVASRRNGGASRCAGAASLCGGEYLVRDGQGYVRCGVACLRVGSELRPRRREVRRVTTKVRPAAPIARSARRRRTGENALRGRSRSADHDIHTHGRFPPRNMSAFYGRATTMASPLMRESLIKVEIPPPVCHRKRGHCLPLTPSPKSSPCPAMPYDPNYPTDGQPATSAPMRAQFQSIVDLIGTIPRRPARPQGDRARRLVTGAVVDGVSTLNPCDPATASASFDGANVHFSFGIPRGNDGMQGPQAIRHDGQPGPARDSRPARRRRAATARRSRISSSIARARWTPGSRRGCRRPSTARGCASISASRAATTARKASPA